MQLHRRPSRQDRKATQVRRAVVVLIFLGIVAVAAGYAYFYVLGNIRPIDSTTFCPTDAKGPSSVTAILLDRTDPFTLTQQTAIQDRLNAVKDNSSRYDMLEVYTVEPTTTELLKPAFSMCNPGRGDTINPWTGNPRLIEEHWQALFGGPLQHLFDNIVNGETAQTSPIMEDIQSIVVTRLGSQELVAKKIPRRLIIISDLLQYVKGYSQYHQPLESFDEFKKSAYYQNVRTDLSGISIEVWYIRRKKTLQLQGDAHIDFWRDYFADQDGAIDKFWYVPGT
jgi:hypothetical protein